MPREDAIAENLTSLGKIQNEHEFYTVHANEEALRPDAEDQFAMFPNRAKQQQQQQQQQQPRLRPHEDGRLDRVFAARLLHRLRRP
jgi:hypothetical protein